MRAVHDAALWDEFKLCIKQSSFEEASALAEKMEGRDKQHAQNIVRMAADWLDRHKRVVAAGGLHILGTERHEARRIDNQLRGRSGRQGDPGSSRFYLSLEDDLMRIFGSERISGVMGKLGMEEGQEIESNMVTKAIANAQKRVEGRNFEIRKHLLEYDDVMNAQREFIYGRRNEVLDGDDISDKIKEYIEDVVDNGIDFYSNEKRNPADWDTEALAEWLKTTFSITPDFDKLMSLHEDAFVSALRQEFFDRHHEKESMIPERDMRTLERMIALQVIDNRWREHLLTMDELRDGIWTVGYGAKDPLVEYKLRGFTLFDEMIINMKQDIVEFLMKVQVQSVVEEIPQHEYQRIGNEFHAETEQFGEGGIFAGAPPQGALARAGQREEAEVEGGVKRRKTRRSRR